VDDKYKLGVAIVSILILLGLVSLVSAGVLSKYNYIRINSLENITAQDNNWTGNNTFYNVTIINSTTYNINGTINASEYCLNDSCINDWSEVNRSYYAGFGLNLGGNTFSVDTGDIQRRVSSSCATGSSIRVINSDGTVICETDDSGGNSTNTVYNESGQINVSSTFGSAQSISFYADITQVLIEGTGTFSANLTSSSGQKFLRRTMRENTWQLLYPDMTVGTSGSNASFRIDLYDSTDGVYNYTIWYKLNE